MRTIKMLPIEGNLSGGLNDGITISIMISKNL